jgi:deazaflavin-dependent oxidoreductase (nitroreductase family)
MMGDDHVARYLETNGGVGQHWNGVECLVLVTTGRRSGRKRAVPLIFGRADDRFVVVASRGGAPEHPQWYRNLADDPDVEVAVGAQRLAARAWTAERDERARYWQLMTARWPDYDRYQSRTDREIPVVVIEPVGALKRLSVGDQSVGGRAVGDLSVGD